MGERSRHLLNQAAHASQGRARVPQDDQARIIFGREFQNLRKVEVCCDQTAIEPTTGFGNGRIRGALERFLSGGRDLMPTAFKWFPPTWVSILVQFDTHYGATSMGNTRSLVISAAKARQAWMSSLVSEG